MEETALDAEMPSGLGEQLVVIERLVVATEGGRFRPLELEPVSVEVGDVLGEMVNLRDDPSPVRSPFAGRFMGFLAADGERLAVGQPIAWLRAEA